KLRAKLGENLSALKNTKDLSLSITSSFEAYKAWAKGRERLFALDSRAAIEWYRRALALDPDYGGAWIGMGYAFYYHGEPDSALAAFRECLARPLRQNESGRMYTAIAISFLTEDVDATLALSDQQVQLDHDRWTVHNNRCDYLMSAGRFQEALECART